MSSDVTITLKGSAKIGDMTDGFIQGDIKRTWNLSPVVLKGSAKIGDMDVGGGYETAYINGKRVINISHNGKTISNIYLGANKLLSFGGTGSVAIGDIRREWVAGGRIIQGSAKIGDMTDGFIQGDIRRTLNLSPIVLKGSAKIGDMDTNVTFGDIRRVNIPEVVNLYDASVTDIGGYLRYANHVFTTGDLTGNRVTYFLASPDTVYKVTMKMDTRFRIWSYNGVPVTEATISNYAIHSLDVNDTTSQGGSVQTLSITTGSGDDRVFIGYWSSGTNAMDYQILRDSIVAEKV